MILVDYITSVALVGLTYLWVQNTRDDELILVKLILRKLSIYLDAVIFMILSKDNKGVGPANNPDPDLAKDKPSKTKTIIFLRHGESDWNNVFNKGINPGMITRAFSAMRREATLFPSLGSVFIDSPLNEEGIQQAVELSHFLQKNESAAGQPEAVARLLKIIRGDSDEKSVIVSSTLRRAVATTTLGLWPRINKTQERISLLSMLQEISRNVDTYQLSPMKSIADLPFERILPHCGGKDGVFSIDAVYDTTENFGTKTRSFYGIKRLEAFADWVFKQPDDVTTIIVGGHSLWFKYFFQTYLPHSTKHDAKTKKISNSGMVAFTLHAHEDKIKKQYRIDPATIATIYGGFTSK